MIVGDYMNPHLVYLRDGNRADIALRPILDFGLTAVPVLDEDHRPVGIVSLRDLVDTRRARRASVERLVTIAASETIENAARVLAAEDVHHLVVVDAAGVAVGMLSSLDVVRGLAGLPPKHAEAARSSAIGDEDELDADPIQTP